MDDFSKGSFHGMQLKSLKSLYARTSQRFQNQPARSKTDSESDDRRNSLSRTKGQWDDVESLSSATTASPPRVSHSLRELGATLSQGPQRYIKKPGSSPPGPPGKDLVSLSLHSKSKFRGDPLSLSLHKIGKDVTSLQDMKSQSLHRPTTTQEPKVEDETEASHDTDPNKNAEEVPYFEKLCWVCEKLDYPFEYADIVGSQFLALDGANPITHIDGHVPSMDELVEFLVDAFVCITEYADMTIVSVDNFQWVDSFSWKIFKELGEKGERLLLIGAMRSHDKQALRRLSTAAAKQTQLLGQMTEITLSSFEMEDIRSITSHVLGFSANQIPDIICSDIFQRTGGLPVFVVQALENIKRANTLVLDKEDQLTWTAEGLKEKVSNSK